MSAGLRSRARLAAALVLGLAATLQLREPTVASAAADRIDSPTEGSSVSGRVEVRGTAAADGPNFRSFRLEFGMGRGPASWRPIGPERDHSVRNGVLGIWETGDLAAGEYTLRLTVFDEQGHDTQSWMRLKVAASGPVEPPAAPSAEPTEPAASQPERAETSTDEPETTGTLPAEETASVDSEGREVTDEGPILGAVIQPIPPGPRPLPRATVRCPILYYHEVPARAQLAAQVAAFLQAGYRPVTMGRLVDAIEGRAEPPPGCLVMTFDDGLASQMSGALPVLVQYGVPATFFVMPGFQDGVHRYMAPRDWRALRDAGMEIGSHTLNHASLPALLRLDYGAFQSELVDSKLFLEEEVGLRVDLLAYPNGSWDQATASEVARAGYRAAASTVAGAWQRPDDRYWLRRIRADSWEAAATVLGRLGR